MNQVSDAVLRWLYNSLKPPQEYHDVERTYSDVADTLTRYTSLSPRTEVHTFENGSSALLLLLRGTIPAQFRGATYRYPLDLWVPYSYPREPPLVYINPTPEMKVRPGQHVSVEGRVYHPYLADWPSRWNEFNVVNLLSNLANVFSKEPPVIARHRAPEPIGPLPPPRPGSGVAPGNTANTQASIPPTQQPRPPPPPPKPIEVPRPEPQPPRRSDTQPYRPGLAAPPLPPKPVSGIISPVGRDAGYGPPLPPLPYEERRVSYDRNTPGYGPRPFPPQDGGTAQQNTFQQAAHINSPPSFRPWSQPPPPQRPDGFPNQPPKSPYVQPDWQQRQQPPLPPPSAQPPANFPPTHILQGPMIQPIPPQPKQAPKDFLTSPTDLTPSKSDASLPAPPIPLNPEKDALLSNISTQLMALLAQNISQNSSAVPALQAQQAAMQRFQQSLTAELSALQQLDANLSSNEQILRDAIRDAENMEKGLSGRELPGVDEVLVAPTVVGEQLYQLVAEERGIADAIFALGRALEKDRVTGEVFIKQTRSLAREQFLKKALIKKIANGMGLATNNFR